MRPLFLVYVIKTHSWSASRISRVKLRQTTVQLGKRAGFNDVGHHLGLTTGAQISVCMATHLSTGPAVPLTGMKTVQERSVLSGCLIVGSPTRWALTTGPNFQDSLHRLLVSVKVTEVLLQVLLKQLRRCLTSLRCWNVFDFLPFNVTSSSTSSAVKVKLGPRSSPETAKRWP